VIKVEEVKIEEKKIEEKIVEEKNKTEEKKLKEKRAEERLQIEKKQIDERAIVDNANYLVNILELGFSKCYKIAQRFPECSKEELLSLYIENPNLWW